MATSNAPLEIGHVALTVNDIDSVGAFYQTALGLERFGGGGETATLGAGNRVLLELRSDPAARRASRREAGLFHTAFLLPSRADLGSWLHHASAQQLAITGASDHGVSEALYMSDPEGNGIEIYVDRPRDKWVRNGADIEMPSDPLDIDALVATTDGSWAGAPDGTVVGHVHLQVGAISEAEAFYAGQLGFTLTHRYPGGSFYGAGGYHHHIATNVWNSRGAGVRTYPATGLAELRILADAEEHELLTKRTGSTSFADPWGTVITLGAKSA